MQSSFFRLTYFLFFVALLTPLRAELKLPALFSDHMVLQQGLETPVWGQAQPGEAIAVQYGPHLVATTTKPDGTWMVRLPAPQIGDNHDLVVRGAQPAETKTFTDVVAGEVWICSGQSNMEWPLKLAQNGGDETAQAQFPDLRLFLVGKKPATSPQTDLTGQWRPCTPETVANFSAVGYFFGRSLHQRLHVPIGLIGTYWGGTPAEAWTPADALKNQPDYELLLERRQMTFLTADGQKKAQEMGAAWNDKVKALWLKKTEIDPLWWNPSASAQGWQEIQVPGFFEPQIRQDIDGSFWVRKVIELPAAFAETAATLQLGAIDDFDQTWINGKIVGHLGVENPDGWKTHRVYPVPAGLLHPGANVILIRIIDRYGPGGFGSNPEALHLDSASGSSVSLVGNWQIRVETSLGRRPSMPEQNIQYLAGTLFDGMIHPLVPYALRGVIWYQGEANAPRAQQYRRLFPQMIQSWRDAWGQGDFPFYFVQLANFRDRKPEPRDSDWAELREAQMMTLAEPKTGMAVTIDIGEEKDIHPRNKKDVGERLALGALAKDYGVTETPGFWGRVPLLKNLVRRPLTHSGPLYKEFSVEGSRIRLTFDHVAEGLVNRATGPLSGFAIAGDDKKFVWAEARIDGPTVVVSSPQVPKPVAVRYAWANNPEISLYNSAGLPASPFRTDTWPGITDGLR